MIKISTNQLQTELEEIIAWFESDQADIDGAAAKYERGLAIASELQKRLKQTKNKITILKQNFNET
ncbi:MAG: exodeoxyribonuclease VII small subunit [bacterium]|nr:exodeoxyribonuclease VII small subunit [bacterium]